MRLILLCVLFFKVSTVFAQQTVKFKSTDGLEVTADLYLQDKSKPFILLFHQANFSRGEYLETAPKFLKTGYNCLAVDLRSGKEVNYIQNETAKKAREQNLPADYIDDEKDIIAAINYVKQYTADKIILAGSMYSGSLALLAANNNPAVIAVIAFSPGEYFEPVHSINKELTGFNKPVFISSTKTEYPFIKEMVAGIPGQLITWYVPTKGEGTQGSRILWSSDADSEECWMSILMFFKNLEPLPGRK